MCFRSHSITAEVRVSAQRTNLYAHIEIPAQDLIESNFFLWIDFHCRARSINAFITLKLNPHSSLLSVPLY